MVSLLLLLAALLPAQETPLPRRGPKAEAKVLAVRPEKPQVKVGETFKVAFDLEITPGWYIYPTYKTTTGTETKVVLEAAEVAGKYEEPKAKVHPKEGDQEAYDYHDGKITLTVPIHLKRGPKPGPFEVKGILDYQICAASCIPRKDPFSFPIAVLEGEVEPAPAAPAAPQGGTSAEAAAQEELDKRGTVGFLLFAMGGGLISLVMPCVYPLIPITVTYFVKQGQGSRAKGIALSSAYAAGIILVFTAIGFLFSILLGADGPRLFAANPWVNLGVGALFFWFAFSLFGLYDISLPSWLVGSATTARRSGVGGAFILGALFSVVTFTCTIPIAAAVLAVPAAGGAGNKFIGLFAMFAYSATMAAPFFLLGLFPSLLKEVPRSGGWLHTVKVTAGFAELALALYYWSKSDAVWDLGVLSFDAMVAVWIATLVFMALYLLRVFHLKGDEEEAPAAPGEPPRRPQVGVARMLFALAFALLAALFASIYAGRPAGAFGLVLPPDLGGPRTAAGGVKVRAVETYAEAVAEANRTGKPAFLHFTAAS
jgi:thiol:disulfide interchange protein DsbD